MIIRAIIMLVTPGPRATAITIAMTSAGNAKTTSVKRMRSSSSSPPLTAAIEPIIKPTTRAKATTPTPTDTSFGVATMIRLKTSLPRRSVPKKCESEGGASLGPVSFCIGPYGVAVMPRAVAIPTSIAVSRKIATVTAPILASRFLPMMARTDRNRAAVLVYIWEHLSSYRSPEPNLRVHDCIQEVGDEVADCYRYCEDYGRREDAWVILPKEGGDYILTQARVGEYVFDEYRSRDEPRKDD